MLAYICRAAVLFSIGVLFTLMFWIHQFQYNVPMARSIVQNIVYPTWWVPTGCGIAAAFVGLVYPCVDKKLGLAPSFQPEWTNVLRCMAIFVGMNHASAKLHSSSHGELILTLAAMSAALWWLCDRTGRGFSLGIITALLAALVVQVVVENGLCKGTDQDFIYIQTLLPCVFFSGGITVGNIGRQLALENQDGNVAKRHVE